MFLVILRWNSSKNGIPDKRGPPSGRRKSLSKYQATLAQPFILADTGQNDPEALPNVQT